MKRRQSQPRPDWRDRVERMGLLFHSTPTEGGPEVTYWNESACYELTADEVDELETATNELHARCLDAVDHVVRNRRFEELGISEVVGAAIFESWRAQDPGIYGRFDLAFGGDQPPKLLEYNADTPTSLLEAAVIQWHWLQDLHPKADQFNSIWEGLVETWRSLVQERKLRGVQIHFTGVDEIEDIMTLAVLRDTAEEAGIPTTDLNVADIGWDQQDRCFVDLAGHRMWSIFKLYPWEWMVSEEFGSAALDRGNETQWFEPIWKMVLSNKAILPILWEMFPDHPNLLPSYADGPRDLDEYVVKPRLGREGANIQRVVDSGTYQTDGPYTDSGFVYQAIAPVPNFDGNFCVIGSWIIGGTARGIGIRESDGPITDNLSRFVPHYFQP